MCLECCDGDFRALPFCKSGKNDCSVLFVVCVVCCVLCVVDYKWIRCAPSRLTHCWNSVTAVCSTFVHAYGLLKAAKTSTNLIMLHGSLMVSNLRRRLPKTVDKNQLNLKLKSANLFKIVNENFKINLNWNDINIKVIIIANYKIILNWNEINKQWITLIIGFLFNFKRD